MNQLPTSLMLSMSPWGMVFCFAYQTDMLCNLERDHQGLENHLPSSWISFVTAPDDDSAQAFCAIPL